MIEKERHEENPRLSFGREVKRTLIMLKDADPSLSGMFEKKDSDCDH
jgi:hypothetical protein